MKGKKRKKLEIEDLALKIDDLSTIMQKGFAGVYRDMATKTELQSFATTTKKDIESLAVTTKKDIENLAITTNKGFDEVHEKISAVHDKMAVMDKKMATKEDLGKLEKRLISRIEQLDLRISSHASSWDKNLDNVNDSILELGSRMNKVEDKLVKIK